MFSKWSRNQQRYQKQRKLHDKDSVSNSISTEYKEDVRKGAYLGKKGYTIPKNILSEQDMEQLYKELKVKPETQGPSYGPVDEGAFPVYRENDNKIYIPRFYGIERYGLPDRSEITRGRDISVNFPKSLRDYQEDIVNTYLNHVRNPICNGSEDHGAGGILEVRCGRGKCFCINTPIMLHNGHIKMVQDIKVGDMLMGDDSTPRKVLSLARGREQMYKVIPTKGDAYIVNESHILSLKYSSSRSTKKKQIPKGTVRDISVLDYLNLPKSYHGKGGVLVGYRVPITFPPKKVELEPYALGYWLGDGNSSTALITTEDSEVVEYFKTYTQSLNCNMKQGRDSVTTRHSLHYNISGRLQDNGKQTPNVFLKKLQHYNLIMNKHIPDDYKYNDRDTQLAILAGIIDSDGCMSSNSYDVIQKNERLLDDIIFIARSLGFAAYKSVCQKSCMYKGEKKTGTYYRTCIHGKGLEEIPVKCPRKKASPRKQIKDALNTRIRLEKLDVDDYYGFEIDGNRRFVLGDFTVTHNTVCALKIISEIQKMTLVIVHKEFLMNQWIDRANEFLPGAKIGKIQGSTFDVEGKDIVIGMLQTLYDKPMPEKAFDCFGLTIIDEVHRIGSEHFSKALLRIISPNMLGLSATVDRKDKLTCVLYMFIGPKVYTETRKSDDPVCVRAIEYISTDSQFNEVENDFKGNPKYSTMISKLCNFGYRGDFIVKVMQDLVSESKEKGGNAQIMVLCHNRSLLTYLYDAITHRGFATVGYYVGGMKQKDLQETEGKQIVLATYAMAAEALDIKTLSILVLATPKTDIIQSVGRILRTKHDNPLVVDIVDKHDLFQNQFRKRKTYYRKCNYRILGSDNIRYQNMTDTTWTTLYEPKQKNQSDKECTGGNPLLKQKCLISIEDLD